MVITFWELIVTTILDYELNQFEKLMKTNNEFVCQEQSLD